MKTLQELYDEVVASAELKKAFALAAKSGKIVEFAKENGCKNAADVLEKTFKNKFEVTSV